MSLFFKDDQNQFTSFQEFLNLKESVEPIVTEYGTDFKNHNWMKDGHIVHTFVNHKNNLRLMISINLNTNIVGFGALKDFTSINPEDYTEDRTKLCDALRVMNKVFYVAFQGINYFDLLSVKFNGSDNRLDKTYRLIITNKFFQNKIDELGFRYDGFENGFYVFKKK